MHLKGLDAGEGGGVELLVSWLHGVLYALIGQFPSLHHHPRQSLKGHRPADRGCESVLAGEGLSHPHLEFSALLFLFVRLYPECDAYAYHGISFINDTFLSQRGSGSPMGLKRAVWYRGLICWLIRTEPVASRGFVEALIDKDTKSYYHLTCI